jgi:hypothetical protein
MFNKFRRTISRLTSQKPLSYHTNGVSTEITADKISANVEKEIYGLTIVVVLSTGQKIEMKRGREL